jgi:hypothetical protein
VFEADSAQPVGGLVGGILAAVLAHPVSAPPAERASVDDAAELRAAPGARPHTTRALATLDHSLASRCLKF